LKNYYDILGISGSASDSEIKKAYRKIAHEFHPDKNSSPGAEEKFKAAAEAYSILGNKEKRDEYDRSRRSSTFNFDDFVNNEFRWNSRDSDFGRDRFRQSYHRGSTRSQQMPDTKYLNIYENLEADLVDLVEGKPINVSYMRRAVTTDMEKIDEEKTLNIHVDLRKKKIEIVKNSAGYSINVKLEGLGNEDVFTRVNAWGDQERLLLSGEYHLIIDVKVPEGVELDDGNIIQYVDVPLSKVLFKGEKVRITTIFDKSYDAEINQPKKINNLKFNIKEGGYLSKSGRLGNYTIKFNVITPDLSEIPEEDLSILKKYII
jgi:DnaJ-class molecular chaperone